MSTNNLSYDSPNSKYDHLFVICRYDKIVLSSNSPSDLVNSIAVVKILTDEVEAAQETDRLNSLVTAKNISNESERPFYFMRLGRIAKGHLRAKP